MTVQKLGINSVLPDNDMQYISMVLTTIERIDKGADVTVSYNGMYSFYIMLSLGSLRNELVTNIQEIHDKLMLKLEFHATIQPKFLKFSLV